MTAPRFTRLVHIGVAALYGVAMLAAIIMLSTRRYEWMVGEIDADGTAATACAVPADVDSTLAMMATLTAAPLALGLLVSLYARNRPFLVLNGLLAFVWAYRFFLRFAGCAA